MKNGAFRFPAFTIQSELQRASVHVLICTEYLMAQNVSFFCYTCMTSRAVVCSWDGYRLCREAESITSNNGMKYGK
jgi:peptide subunit release factor 1 (eRF1)